MICNDSSTKFVEQNVVSATSTRKGTWLDSQNTTALQHVISPLTTRLSLAMRSFNTKKGIRANVFDAATSSKLADANSNISWKRRSTLRRCVCSSKSVTRSKVCLYKASLVLTNSGKWPSPRPDQLVTDDSLDAVSELRPASTAW